MTRVQLNVTGLQEMINDLRRVGASGRDVLEGVLTDLALDTHREAVRGIQGGPNSGRVYQKYNPRRTHQASAPGQYPASDTGRLASNVIFDLPRGNRLRSTVGTNILYGEWLEFGTSRMAARPWLVPSVEKARVGVGKKMKAQFEALAGGASGR